MNKEKIAILIDSCTDVPRHLIESYGMYLVPQKIIYKDREYYDGIDITAEEVYQNLSKEIPKTSLPSGEYVQNVFDRIRQDGYEKVIAVTISSGLSGTYNLISLMARQNEDLQTYVFDTRDIAIAAGFHAIRAAEMVKKGLPFEEIIERLEKERKMTKVHFCVATLEYLQKGGRIGLVASMLGTALNLKPIISCNDQGIYYTVTKVRGRKQSITKVLDLSIDFAKNAKRYHIALYHGNAKEEADELKKRLMEELPNCEIFVEGQISPALGVHTGPGLIGIAMSLLDE